MTLCRSRRRQVVEIHYCLLFCWPHNPKVGGSNPPPATKLTDLQRLAGMPRQAVLAFGKDFTPVADGWLFYGDAIERSRCERAGIRVAVDAKGMPTELFANDALPVLDGRCRFRPALF
jgi:hypothetical protein